MKTQLYNLLMTFLKNLTYHNKKMIQLKLISMPLLWKLKTKLNLPKKINYQPLDQKLYH